MKKYHFYIIIGLGLFLTACGGEKSIEKEIVVSKDNSLIEVSDEQFSSMKMQVASLQERSFDAVVKAAGKVDVPPKDRVKLTSYVAGYVKAMPLLVGSKVSKGQVLLSLESPEYIDLQQSYMEIAGQMDYLKSEYERQKTLFEENIASQKKYLEAESDYKRAKATYESLRQKLNVLHISPAQVEKGRFSSTINIYSPINGDIASINVTAGMAVSPSDVILEVVNTDAMHLELAVFEKDIFNLHNGQEVKFTIPQVGSEVFTAKVSQIGKSVEGEDRVVNVYASLDKDVRNKMLTGMFVEAELIAASRKALSIPYDAVVNEESKQFILVLDNYVDGEYTFKKVLVTIGERNGDWIEIILKDELSKDAKFLFKGVYDLI